MGDHPGSEPFVPIVWVTDDDPDFAASMGGINVFQCTVADEDCVSVHREQFMLSSGKILRTPRLDIFEGAHPWTQILVDRRTIAARQSGGKSSRVMSSIDVPSLPLRLQGRKGLLLMVALAASPP